MNISEFLKINKDIRGYNSNILRLYKKVVVQSSRHTTRSDMEALQKKARPNEDPIFTNWRNSNLRHVTVDFILQFERMLKRVLSQTLVINYEYDGLERIIFNRLIPLSIQDPNSIIVYWPFIEGNKEVAPASEQFNENEALSVDELIIYSSNLVEKTDDIVIYILDQIEIKKQKINRYVGIDNTGYYILTPRQNSKKQIEYQIIDWYVHDLGFLPIATLPGITIYNIDETKYQESICWPSFEWFDEGVVRMSSEQVVSIKHANAKLVVGTDVDCPTCNGQGFTGTYGKDNLIDPSTKKECPTCNGTRTLSNLSDFSTVKLKNTHQPGDSSNSQPIYYLEPPGGIKELQDAFMLFFEKGNKSLCNDLLEGTGNESGIAKELRLEPRQDLMQSYGQQLAYMIEDMVNCKNLLTGKTKDLIKVVPPSYYETKSPELLKLQVVNALQGERYIQYMKWVNNEFKDNEFKVKLHQNAVLYAPLILYKAEEFDTAFNSGTYTERDAIRRDYAFYAIEEVLKKNPKLDDIKQIKELADELLIEQGFLKEEDKELEGFSEVDKLINQAQTVEELPKNLDTAEEALTHYIQGELNKQMAVKILMLADGYTEEEAMFQIEDLKYEDEI